MDYEKAYKEALERAKYLKENTDGVGALDVSACFEQIFPELCESEDERIRKELVAFLERKQLIPTETKNEWIAWLENQKIIDVLDEEERNFAEDVDAIRKMCDESYQRGYTEGRRIEKEIWLEKQDEQNPVVESKPKFNVGDWITNGEYTWKIIDIKPLDYIIQSQTGSEVDDTISYIDEYFHLWTIQDAKEGDVLVSVNSFIFRDFGDRKHPNNPTAYCGINSSGTFILSEGNDWWTEEKDVHPATKEQRDLLFKKMHEAGYEWDAEKKELKKIDNKQDMVKALRTEYEKGRADAIAEMKTIEWSEEDEFWLKEVERCVRTEYPLKDSKIIDWLKSIKPQFHWKPSEEQMLTLSALCVLHKESKVLESLYNDLKKL